jgi:hypothetical protein
LRKAIGAVSEKAAIAAELDLRDALIEKHRKGFNKSPDTP